MLKHVNVPFEEQIINLYSHNTNSEILKYSPSGKIPLLIHNKHLIWDSMSIAEYLNELFPIAQLWPHDFHARTFARSICNEMHSGFINLRNLMPFSLHDSKVAPISKPLNQDIQRIEAIWQECFHKYSEPGKYLFNTFSIADAMFAPVVLRFKTYNYKSKTPEVVDYCETIMNNPFIKEWIINS